ncbi:enolase C-terminal domain-like protein [Thermoactinospora rubra]|uniref:enolase C-terminal domain-like protein n=1 Tax=Thermoactinospora rubra TaxID=1088767 RepID=UPI0011806131|nr:enolase C-terminal domain-like protein [Thermoactinospora rubra]
MMRVLDTVVSFRPVPFTTTLMLSSGPITGLTEALVEVTVLGPAGRPARGRGSVLLSYPWTGEPGGDAAMRQTAERFARDATGLTAADPLRLGVELTGDLTTLTEIVCAAPLDAALHDAWANALGGRAYENYTAEHLAGDLGDYLGPEFRGRYPADFLRAVPRPALPVQHVVGVGDPLTPGEGGRPLTDWMAAEGVRCFKVKVAGRDPVADARRIADVYRVATAGGRSVWLSLDPNEAYSSPEAAAELLHALARLSPAAHRAVRYMEQPVPRDSTADMSGLARMLPVLADESVTGLAGFASLRSRGWPGLALKTARGHTLSLLAYCWARRHGLFTAMQDLTCTGDALLHSAAFASYLDCSVPTLECNSRQYAPEANTGRAGLLAVRDGELSLSALPRKGIR